MQESPPRIYWLIFTIISTIYSLALKTQVPQPHNNIGFDNSFHSLCILQWEWTLSKIGVKFT